MSKASKNRIKIWFIAIGVAFLFMLIADWTAENPNKTTILVKAPDTMLTAFRDTFEKLKLDKDYSIEATEDITKANFVVREGMNKEGKLLAYSPIVAVFNRNSEYKESLSEEGYFVTSTINSYDEDFDFNKVIQEALSGKCKFKIYYPSKDSDSWEEFYHFMLFTVNDGYYPGTVEEMKKASQITNNFLNSKYAESFNNNTIERSNGIPQNTIYFMAYADLARLYEKTGGFTCRVMYPKTVVYHSYYATYDELGKILYDTFDADIHTFLSAAYNIGYERLRREGYNTKYSIYTSGISNDVYGSRDTFNAVEIPSSEISIYKEGNNNER